MKAYKLFRAAVIVAVSAVAVYKIGQAALSIFLISSHPQTGSFTDPRDGQKYSTVKTGAQTWMSKNLNYKTVNSKCYGNSADSCAKYGRMYTWDDAKNACPAGWHLPANDEWDKLMVAVGGIKVEKDNVIYWNKAGKKLKSTTGWNKNGNGTFDRFAFSALPGGMGDFDGSFDHAGDHGNWWSATEINATGAWGRRMSGFDGVGSMGTYKTYLFSVRCVRD